MTPSQRTMFFASWQHARRALRAYVRAPAEADAMRKKIYVKVGAVQKDGSPKETVLLNNRDIDRCLAEFFAWSEPDNLKRQLDLIDQPYTRALASENAIFFLEQIGIEEHGRRAYLNAICKRIFKKDLLDLDDDEWPDILAALNHTRMHKQGIAHKHRPKTGASRTGAAAPAATEKDADFDRWVEETEQEYHAEINQPSTSTDDDPF